MSDRAPIGVVGIGWVGLVTAACFAELGSDVVALDILTEKVDALRRGEAPFYEPGMAELLERNRERLHFTAEMSELLEGRRLLFCCVDTPPTYSGDADLSRVDAVVSGLAGSREHALVMKSTVPAGTGAAIRRRAPELSYVSCPEFLKEGTAVADFMHPDRVVIGTDPGDEAAAAVEALYAPLGGEIVRTDVASAEMIKLAANAFLATKISFINEIANVCEEVGADVTEVARGMGLDQRIGSSFLRAGIGYGGSCFSGKETLLVKLWGSPRLVTFEQLWGLAGGDEAAVDGEAIEPESLNVWSWVPGEPEPEWMPVSVLTKRDYVGEMVEVRTKMGRRVTVTADHPFIVGDGRDGEILTHVLARDLTEEDWLPLAVGSVPGCEPDRYSLMGAIEDGHVPIENVMVRPGAEAITALASRSPAERREIFANHRRPTARMGDVKRTGTLRLSEACLAEISLGEATLGTAKNGTFCTASIELDESFWRVAGLYVAEGHIARDRDSGRQQLSWSFHPEHEDHLAEEVVRYWARQGVSAKIRRAPTAKVVSLSSRILAEWWVQIAGFGLLSYSQRIPELAWSQSPERKRAFLSGIWEGDGSWSLINQGPSVILEWGTISDELADGVSRMLGELGFVCSWRRGRTAKSTKETHWLRVSGADQVERAIDFLVPERDRDGVFTAIGRQAKRIKPTGYRQFFGGGPAWVRVVGTTTRPASERVYSLKVPGSQTIVGSGGLIQRQCFPKDVSALKQLAGNTGYHFQLLNSVIEVNELQKRRVIGKLAKHLGTLVGKRVALLGLSFKPDTDDMREASSLVLAARLQGEGATVVAYDPVAEERAAELLPAVALADSAAEAVAGADAAILVTEWPEFEDLDWPELAKAMASPVLVDGRNFLDPAAMRQAGFTYESIGRPAASPAR